MHFSYMRHKPSFQLLLIIVFTCKLNFTKSIANYPKLGAKKELLKELKYLRLDILDNLDSTKPYG